MSYDDKAATMLKDLRTVTQAKRDDRNNSLPDWQSGVLYDQLMALAEAGHGNHIAIPVNDSQADMEPLMPRTMSLPSAKGMVLRRDLNDSDYRHVTPEPRTRSTPAGAVAPLLKRATSTALEKARSIVQKAIAESAERNEGRYKSPQRNKYRLRPGTVVGPTVVERPSGYKRRAPEDADPAAPVPLLEITDEIADAAALVAEADAMAAAGTFRNVTAPGNLTMTRRQASSGTFWMASIARKGIVPWGDNSTYAVFRNVRDYGASGNGVTVSISASSYRLDIFVIPPPLLSILLYPPLSCLFC